MKKLIVAIFMIPFIGFAQVKRSSELYATLKKNDSIIFKSSFETCNLDALAALINDDFEFYHDKGGFQEGKSTFIEITKNGLCKSQNELKRELDENSLEIYPMYKNDGSLYAAIQKGVHYFHENGAKVGVAKFNHLWIIKDEQWLLKRVLSYDHQPFIPKK